MTHAPPAPSLSPLLPPPRGPLSEAVARVLPADPGEAVLPPGLRRQAEDADPFGDDLQLALHLCYELHYRGFADAAPGWEWDPQLLALRQSLERPFLAALRAGTPGGDDVEGAVQELLTEPPGGSGLSRRMKEDGDWWQMQELFAHRSVYHLKEADPHVWALPRLQGRAKAGLAAVEYDEFGAGRGEQVHARLFADLLRGAGLDDDYLAHLDRVPACMLAVVNQMSLFGLHRELRGALVGHFAAVETTSSPSSRRMAQALRRMGADPACVFFYTEHVEADAVHEQVVRHDVIGGLLADEPSLAGDIVFGIAATGLVEDRFTAHLSRAWDAGRTSLRRPLAAV